MAKKGQKRKRTRGSKSSSDDAATRGEGPFCRGWLWWSRSPDAPRRPPKDDFDKRLPADIRKEFHELMRAYRDRPEDLKPGLHYKDIGGGLWELRIKRHNNPYRLIFMRWEGWAVALDVFFKNQQKTPTERAAQRRQQWLDLYCDTPRT